MTFAKRKAWRLAAALCWWLFVAMPVSAQKVQFTFEPASSMPTLAENRPAMTEWIAAVHGPGLLEGRLELTLLANGQRLTTFQTDELVFTGQDQKVRILLPPLNWYVGTDELLVELRLRTKDGVLRLPQQRLRTLTTTSRKFPLLIGETAVNPRSTKGRDRLVDRLRFETILPAEPVDLKDRALTVMSHLIAAEFPQDPLSYCHYEAIVIAEDVFALLRPSQLEALLAWVKAGGSIYVEPAGILENAQLDFLNRLAEDDPRKLVFAVDDKGYLPKQVYFAEAEFVNLSVGLGTAVIGLPDDLLSVSETDWRNAHATLWKLREDQRQQIAASGTVKLPDEAFVVQNQNGFGPNQAVYGTAGGGGWQNQQIFGLSNPPLTDVVHGMVDWLRPKGVRMVPLWVIATLLSTLVVLIGPLDYFLLTWLRRRKWTWFTFPLAVVAMTSLTMWVTNRYLSSAESRRAFILHDVGNHGDILRSNRFELVFTASSRRLVSDVHSALFTPLLTGGLVDPRYGGAVRAGQQVVYVAGPDGRQVPTVVNISNAYGIDTTAADAAAFQGRAPSRYQALQEVRQWTPQLNRILTIGPPADLPAINWDAFTIPVVPDVNALRERDFNQLLSQVRDAFGPSANLAIYASTKHQFYDEFIFASDHTMAIRGDPYQQYGNYNQWQFQAYPQNNLETAASLETMKAVVRLTSVMPQGLAQLTTRTSPHGGRTLDDLPLYVSGAGDRWWLAVIVPQGEDFVVYRKSYAYSR